MIKEEVFEDQLEENQIDQKIAVFFDDNEKVSCKVL